jgi:hypothetical protein
LGDKEFVYSGDGSYTLIQEEEYKFDKLKGRK